MAQPKCANGNKPCGKRCIPKTQKCRLSGEGAEEKKGLVGKAKDAVGDTAKKAKDMAGDAANKVKETTGDAVDAVKDKAEDVADDVKKMSTKKKIAIAAGVGIAAIAGGALIYGVNTGKVKLPTGEEINPFSTTNKNARMDKIAQGDTRALNQQRLIQGLEDLTQPVTAQADKAFEKVNAGFSSIQKAVLDSDGKFSMDLTAQSIGNMANGIVDSSKTAATALNATVQAQSTLMMASMKENLTAAGVNIKALMESTKQNAQGVADNISYALSDDEENGISFTPSQKLDRLKSVASFYIEGGREFAGSKLREGAAAAKNIGGQVTGFAQSTAANAQNAYVQSGGAQVVRSAGDVGKDATQGAIEFFQDFNANLMQNGANVISQFGNSWQDGAKAFFGSVGSIFSGPTNGVSKEIAGMAGAAVGLNGNDAIQSAAEKVRSKAPATNAQKQAQAMDDFVNPDTDIWASDKSKKKTTKRKKDAMDDFVNPNNDVWG